MGVGPWLERFGHRGRNLGSATGTTASTTLSWGRRRGWCVGRAGDRDGLGAVDSLTRLQRDPHLLTIPPCSPPHGSRWPAGTSSGVSSGICKVGCSRPHRGVASSRRLRHAMRLEAHSRRSRPSAAAAPRGVGVDARRRGVGAAEATQRAHPRGADRLERRRGVEGAIGIDPLRMLLALRRIRARVRRTA
jgi:hypothetical protein